MLPNLVHEGYCEKAFAAQVTAKEYLTFVAMPFRESFSYRSRQVFEDLICAAAEKANTLIRNSRTTPDDRRCRYFARPRRADDAVGVAGEIPDDIVRSILDAHVFVADLTLPNRGVDIELGIALGLKPNSQIVFLLDADASELHFDVRNRRVINYRRDDPTGSVAGKIAEALRESVRSFEDDTKAFVDSIKRKLTAGAIVFLNHYHYNAENQLVSSQLRSPLTWYPSARSCLSRFLRALR